MPAAFVPDIRRFAELDSTNRYLLDLAREGAPAGVVVAADHQTAGRGRRGRTWEAPSGANLLVSMLLRPALTVDERYLASAAVTLAAMDALGRVEPELAGLVRVKWPNDLLGPGGAKLAGVLAEADLSGGGTGTGEGQSGAIVVGIGLNVGWPGEGDEGPLGVEATSLSRLAGRPVDRDAVFDALVDAVVLRAADLESPAGRRRLAGDLKASCSTLGTRVRVELADGRFEGVATDLTPEGHLVVVADGVSRIVVAGDVVHLRSAGA